MLSLLINPILGFSPLLHVLNPSSTRHGTDFDFLHRSREVRVEAKGIIIVDVPRRRMLLQHFEFRTCQRLQVSLEFRLGEAGRVFDFLSVICMCP